MVEIDKSEYLFTDTLKPADIEKAIDTRITDVKSVKTKYGDKRIAVLETGQQVFLNAMSLQNLVEALGNETDKWIGSEITLDTEVSERTQGKKSIVLKVNK